MANIQNRVLWWALVNALVIYVVVAHVVEIEARPSLPIGMMTVTLGALSLAVGIGTLIFRRIALVGPIQSGDVDLSTPEGLQMVFVPYIINLVLSESVGIYGLVLSLLSGDARYSIVFTAAALLLMYLHRPTAHDLVPPMSGAQRAQDSSPIE